MERKQSVNALMRIGASAVITLALCAACTDTLTDARPVPVSADTSAKSTTTTRVDALDVEAEPPATVELPPDGDPTADPEDPVAVATALVTVLTNYRNGVSESTWHDRWSRWVTPALAADLNDNGAHGTYFQVGRTGKVVAVGVIVGSARRACSNDRCQVIVLADETLLVDGQPLDERNFVSWQIDLERTNASGWRASRISFGGAA